MKRYTERLYLENLPDIIDLNMNLSKNKRIDLICLFITVRDGELTEEELESIEKRLTLAQRFLTKG